MKIPLTHYLASRAALEVESRGPPSQGVSNAVNQASLENTSGRGYKHCFKFSVEEIIQKEVTVN